MLSMHNTTKGWIFLSPLTSKHENQSRNMQSLKNDLLLKKLSERDLMEPLIILGILSISLEKTTH